MSEKTVSKNEVSKHICGSYNNVMGKGSFTKIGEKFQCLECSEVFEALPEEWIKANPASAKLLLKGQKNEGPKSPIMVEAGKKAWETRRKNQATVFAEKPSTKGSA
jgi:hypothetical protein